MKKFLFLAVAVCLVGCGTMQPKKWYKDGSTEQDFYMDQGQCKAQAFGVSGVSMLQAAMVYNSCLQGKGWYQQ